LPAGICCSLWLARPRLPIAGSDHLVFLPAAGLPWFIAPFGRDSLIVSLQNTLIYPEFARGALEFLGSLQAKEVDNYRDAEPGKILHEMRYGELAHFKLIPHTPYYGTADAMPLWWRLRFGFRWLTDAHSDLKRRRPAGQAAPFAVVLSWHAILDRRKHIVRRQRSPDALQLEFADRLNRNGVLDLHQHPSADEDLTRLGFIAEPRGDV
jgi:hypothetical protein